MKALKNLRNYERSGKKQAANWRNSSCRMEIVQNKTGLAFYYNYLLSTQPPEFENYPKFLQKPDVRKSIHVGNLTYDDTR